MGRRRIHWALLPLLFASTAYGQQAAPAEAGERNVRPVTLDWGLDVADPCLDAATFHDGVRQALGREPFAPREATSRTLRVTAEGALGEFAHVRLTLQDGARAVGSRIVDVRLDDCKRARETVALVAAMLLDVPEEPVTEVAKPLGPLDQPEALEPPAPRPVPVRHTLQAVTSALFTTSFGPLPLAGFGADAELVLARDHRPLARATAGAAWGATVQTPSGEVRFRAAEFSLGAVPLVLPLGPSVTAFAVGSLHLTGVFATPSGFDVTRDEVRWVPSASAGLTLAARPFSAPLVFSLQGGAFVAFSRPRFTILTDGNEKELHRVSSVGARLAAGIGWEFR